MQLRIFNDLKDQPVLFNMTPTQPWDPSTISYSGSECTGGRVRVGGGASRQAAAPLQAAGGRRPGRQRSAAQGGVPHLQPAGGLR